jgi:chaperonin cofactor prefoldin
MKKFELNKIIRETFKKIQEVKISDPQLSNQIKEFAKLSEEIDKASNELKKLERQYKELETIIRPVLEELKETQDRALEVDNILVTIKKAGFERTSSAYKEAFEWLLERVNGKMKTIAMEAIEATKKTSYIASSIGVQKINEINNSIINKLKKYWGNLTNKIKTGNKQIENIIDEFHRKLE